MRPNLQVSWHHERIAEKLEAVERGEIKRLMILMPPRHSKSTLTTKLFSSWYTGKHPEQEIMTCSYGDALATEFGRESRNMIESDWYQNVFPGMGLKEDSRAANRYHTTKGGVFVAAGIGGAITGRGAHLAIIDDPIKDWVEADSPTVRQGHWDWYTSTFYSRLMPGAAVVLVMTRWHDDDLAGRLIKQMDEGGEHWDVLSLPAISTKPNQALENGEALWPAWYPVKELLKVRQQNIRAFDALWQQRPRKGESKIKREWFKIVDQVPRGLRGVRFWDMAATKPKKGRDPDFTAGLKMLANTDGEYWIEDLQHFRETPLINQQRIKQTAVMDDREIPVRMEQEPGSSGVGQIDTYKRLVLAGWDFDGVLSTGEKATRFNAFAAAAEAGLVYILRGPWNKAFLDEMEQPFEPGLHDDIKDTCSGGHRFLTGGYAAAQKTIINAGNGRHIVR